jgi:hypothetical protein
VFLWQQWLRERAVVLRYTYITNLVNPEAGFFCSSCMHAGISASALYCRYVLPVLDCWQHEDE